MGGLLNLNQLLWLLAGLGIGGSILIGMVVFTENMTISFFIAFPFLIFGFPFAFVKKHDMPLFRYLMLKRAHKRKVHYLSNIKKGVKWK